MKTKKLFIPLFIGLAMIAGLFSCEKKTDDTTVAGKIEFSLAQVEDLSGLKSAAGDTANNDSSVTRTFQIMISITDRSGNTVMEDRLIPLYVFGNGFVSEKIEMSAGEFLLQKFMVLNNSGEVIYAAPMKDSPRAYLVSHPLPVHFSVYPGETSKLAPEVLPVAGFSPSDFGYATFGVQIVKPWNFWVMAVIDNPLLMRPSLLTEAKLYLKSPKGWSHEFHLQAMPNKLEIVPADYYEAIAYVEGYPEVKFRLYAKEVLASSELNPCVIKVPGVNPNIMVFRPGPEIGKDSRITDLEPDKNFGNYKYLECTYMSEPILTVMRTTRSLIAFNLDELPMGAIIESVMLSLFYDFPIPWDDSLLLSKGPWDSTYPWYGAALQQIIEPWEESEVTWNKQPQTVEYNQVLITPFVKNTNFIDVDVTRLFVSDPNTDGVVHENFGMMLKLYPEPGLFQGLRFASSDYPDSRLWPKLTVKYSLYGYPPD